MKGPYCAEEIKNEAKKCQFCGEWLDKASEPKIISKEDRVPTGRSTPLHE